VKRPIEAVGSSGMPRSALKTAKTVDSPAISEGVGSDSKSININNSNSNISNNNSISNKSNSNSNNSSVSGTTGMFGRGLEATVRDLFQSYQPSSWEKKPFYCRACTHQSADLAEFEAHKRTKEHLAQVEVERKASFCKACRKQFTSPEQLKEHIKGKLHLERVERYNAQRASGKKFC
jgi:hypothetical protein